MSGSLESTAFDIWLITVQMFIFTMFMWVSSQSAEEADFTTVNCPEVWMYFCVRGSEKSVHSVFLSSANKFKEGSRPLSYSAVTSDFVQKWTN